MYLTRALPPIVASLFSAILFIFSCSDISQDKERVTYSLSTQGQVLFDEIQPLIYSDQKKSLQIAKDLKKIKNDSLAQLIGDYYIAKNNFLVSNRDDRLIRLLDIYDRLAEKKQYELLYHIDILAYRVYLHRKDYEKAAERMELTSKYIFEPGLKAQRTVVLYGLGEPFDNEDKQSIINEILSAINSISEKKWSKIKADLHLTLGKAYEANGEHEKAEETMKHAAEKSIKNGFLVQATGIYQYLSEMKSIKPEQALEYAKKPIELIQNTGYKSLFELSWRTLGHRYMDLSSFEDSYDSFKKAINHAEMNKDTSAIILDNIYAGSAYFNTNKLQHAKNAIDYIDRAIEISDEEGMDYLIALERKKWIYDSIGDLEKADSINTKVKSVKSELLVVDQINSHLITSNLHFQEANEKIITLNSANKLQAQKLSNQKFVSLSLILLGLIFPLLLALYWQRTRLLKENKKRQMELLLLNSNLKRKNHLIHIQNQELVEKEEKAQEELRTKVTLLSRNLNIFEKINEEIQGKEIDSVSKRNMLNLINHDYNKQVIDDIENQFSATNQEFIEKLIQKHPELTSNNVKLCVYLKMGLTSKEISAINYTAISSVKVARSRLRKKLGIDDGIPLISYFNSLEKGVSTQKNMEVREMELLKN